MNGLSIRLRCGHDISLKALNQWQTYEGLLTGLPTREMNRQDIERTLAEARDLWGGGVPVHLIPPVERPLQYRGGDPHPFGEPAALPGITCIGRFESFQPARDQGAHFSSLVIVWFQDEFALPIEKPALDSIQAVDWPALADDGLY